MNEPHLFIWMTKGLGGTWAPISARMPGAAEATPLLATVLPQAQALRRFAESHAEATGRPVHLVHFGGLGVLERIAPRVRDAVGQ